MTPVPCNASANGNSIPAPGAEIPIELPGSNLTNRRKGECCCKDTYWPTNLTSTVSFFVLRELNLMYSSSLSHFVQRYNFSIPKVERKFSVKVAIKLCDKRHKQFLSQCRKAFCFHYLFKLTIYSQAGDTHPSYRVQPSCLSTFPLGDCVRHALDRGSSLCEWLVQALVLASAFVACERGQEVQCGQPGRE